MALGLPLVACADTAPAEKAQGASAQVANTPWQPPTIRLTYVEFLVPAERAAALAEGTPDFAQLMADAKAGKVGVVPNSFPIKDGVQATLKQTDLVRFPESHGYWGSEPEETPPAPPPAPGAAAAPDAPAPKPPVRPAPGVALVLPQVCVPQDFTEKEVGLVIDVVPTLAEGGATLELDFKPKRTVMELAPGQIKDACGFPCMPQFSVLDLQTKMTLRPGVPAHVATVAPTDLSKERRIRVVFVRVDVSK